MEARWDRIIICLSLLCLVAGGCATIEFSPDGKVMSATNYVIKERQTGACKHNNTYSPDSKALMAGMDDLSGLLEKLLPLIGPLLAAPRGTADDGCEPCVETPRKK
jgi:hypothetical protein